MLLPGFGCGEESISTSSDSESETSNDSSPKSLTQNLVYEMAVKRAGDAALLRAAVLSPQAGDKTVLFELNRPEVCHDGALVGIVSTFSQKTMSSLFKYPEVSRVEVTMYGATQDLATKNEVAVKVAVDRATAEKIDWFNVRDTNMSTLFTSFYIDTRVQANWQVEGGDSTPRSEQASTASASPST
jgi:flavin-binding protein dodecin